MSILNESGDERILREDRELEKSDIIMPKPTAELKAVEKRVAGTLMSQMMNDPNIDPTFKVGLANKMKS